jgi:hypothetical protein
MGFSPLKTSFWRKKAKTAITKGDIPAQGKKPPLMTAVSPPKDGKTSQHPKKASKIQAK